MISIQTEDFNAGSEYQALVEAGNTGAVVTFVGRVRDFDKLSGSDFHLEHYPGMTEKSLQAILDEAAQRWQLDAIRVIHRVGRLLPADQIVFVGVSSPHRREAFAACEFVMDYLKTRAPFWKKEFGPTGARWVDAKQSDEAAAARWKK